MVEREEGIGNSESPHPEMLPGNLGDYTDFILEIFFTELI